jgi:PAS domain S-box-containing protein
MLFTYINLILILLGAAFLVKHSSQPALSILSLLLLATATVSIADSTHSTFFHPQLLILLSFIFLAGIITLQIFFLQKKEITPPPSSLFPSSSLYQASPDEKIWKCIIQITDPNALHSDWNACFNKVQPRIRKALEVDALFLLDNSPSLGTHQLFQNTDQDNTPNSDWILTVPGWMDILEKGQFIHNLAENFDPGEQVLLEQEGIKVLLLIPLIVNKKLIAVLGLSRTNKTDLFNQQQINSLLFIGNILAMAISNQSDRSERDRLVTVVEQSSDCTIIIDTKGSILYANPACEDVTGYSPDEIVGSSIKHLYTPDIRSSIWKRMKKSIINGESWSGQFTNYHKDKTLYQEEMLISPVFDQDGGVANQVIIKRNITEEKRLESIAEAANLMDNIGFIFSSIRHELGNPINAIKVSLSVLESNLEIYDTDDIKRFISRGLSDIGRVEYLLKTLKNFSIFERPDITATDMVTLLDKLTKLTGKDLAKHYVMLAINHPNKPLTGMVDPRAFLQVLLNLVTNAVAALEQTDNKQITLSLMQKQDSQITLVIEDNGCGMDEDTVRNLFRPFFTTKPEGTGLGLVIVKKMLSKMNCSITANSEKWKGTRIEIIIPAA